MIYFVEAVEARAVKVGYCVSVVAFERRLSVLQTANSARLRTIGTIKPGDRRLERAIHRALAAYRLRGEWFRLSPRVRGKIGLWLQGWPIPGARA